MAGRVPDGEVNRLLFGLGPKQGFAAPGIPLDRIARMLAEIRTRFRGKTIGAVQIFGFHVGSSQARIVPRPAKTVQRRFRSGPVL